MIKIRIDNEKIMDLINKGYKISFNGRVVTSIEGTFLVIDNIILSDKR
jgi:hypothetical protein